MCTSTGDITIKEETMETKFDGLTKEEIIEMIAEKLDFLPEDMKETMIKAAFFQMLQ